MSLKNMLILNIISCERPLLLYGVCFCLLQICGRSEMGLRVANVERRVIGVVEQRRCFLSSLEGVQD